MILSLLILTFPALVIYAAISDVMSMTISNKVSMALVAAFVVVALAMGMPWTAIGWHFAAGFVVLVAGIACFAMGWIGGGDAKVAAAIALWMGAADTMTYLAVSSAIGGLLTLALLSIRARPLPEWALRQAWIARLYDPRNGVPYGVALAAGALVVFPGTPWMVGTVV